MVANPAAGLTRLAALLLPFVDILEVTPLPGVEFREILKASGKTHQKLWATFPGV